MRDCISLCCPSFGLFRLACVWRAHRPACAAVAGQAREWGGLSLASQAGMKTGAVRKLSYLPSVYKDSRPYPVDLLEALLHFVQCDDGGRKGRGEVTGGCVQTLVFVQRMRDRELEGMGGAGRRLVGLLRLGLLRLKPMCLESGVGPDSRRIVGLRYQQMGCDGGHGRTDGGLNEGRMRSVLRGGNTICERSLYIFWYRSGRKGAPVETKSLRGAERRRVSPMKAEAE